MDDHSSTQSFAAHHHHHSFHLNLRNLQTPELGYTSTQSSLDPLEQYGNREEESTTSFLISTPSSVERRARNGSDRGLLNTSGSSLDGDPNIGSHLDGEQEIGSHFADTWYGSSKKDVWEDRESFESSAEYFYSKADCYSKLDDVLHTMNCGNDEGIRYKLPANNNSHANCETKSEAMIGYQANSYSRSGSESVDYCRTNSTASDNYTGRDEDYGSSCGSGEDHLQPAEIEGPWPSVSPSRRPTDTHTLASGCLLQHSPIGSSRTYPQKLDSFSEAFLSQGKRTFTGVPSGDFAGQSWEFGRGESPGLGKSRHSCAFDSDSCLPPASCSPVHSSRGSFPSPPTSSHLVSSVLSPPPTPRPPPSYSPSKMDSPSAFGASGHSVSHGGEPLGTLQFFASHLQSLPSVNSSGMIWRFPVMAQNFSQSSSNVSSVKSNRRPSQGNVTTSQNIPKSAEPPLLASSRLPSALCHSSTPSLHSPFHLPSLSSQHYETTENTAPYMVTHRRQNGSTNQNPSQLQHQTSQTYTGTPFPSMLHSCRGQKRGYYTPRPLLNPARGGQGLYSSLLSHCHRAEVTAGGPEDDSDVLPYINVGSDFQAEVPPCFLSNVGSEVWSPEEQSPQEQLLWKPCDKLQQSTTIQEQVEKLLSMCSSSCLPGGGSNTELALHCLHYCQGDTMATLEMLLFSKPSPTGNYHYSGSDFWTDAEKTLFSAAVGTYRKEFPLIQKMVRTKTIRQCVEFFYLNKKLQDKQEKQKEEENRNGETERQTSITPTCQPVNRPFALEGVVPVPSLAGFFPCKLCGKMFYKIKSRNAHMKIHRQPQEDWTDRRLQHQLLTQHLGSNLLPAQVPVQSFSSSLLQGRKSSAETVLNSLTNSHTIAPSNTSILDPSPMATCSNNTASSSHVITDNDGGEPAAILPFYQSWGSFGHSPDPVSFFCNTEGKDVGGAGTVGSKEPIKWQ